MLSRRTFISALAGTGILAVPFKVAEAQQAQDADKLRLALARNRILRVVAVSGSTLYGATSGGRPQEFKLTPRTAIWNGKYTSDPSAIKPGDEVAVRGELDGAGQLIASEIWVNTVRLEGVVLGRSGDEFDVASLNGPQMLDHLKEAPRKAIRISSDTEHSWGLGDSRDIQVGRYVEIIGVNTGSIILASRITVYADRDGKVPLHMTQGQRILPRNGPALKQ